MDTITIILNELKKQNKKQIDLTDFLGLSKNAITEWKSGRNKSYTKYIYQIAAFLDVSPQYLLGETEERQKENPPTTQHDERVAKVMDIVNKIPEDRYNLLLRVLQEFAQDDQEKS